VAVRLHHVQVAIPQGGEGQALDFYEGLLGLTEAEKPDGLRDAGGVWFAEGLHLGTEMPFTAARRAHPGLAVDDLDGLAARLQAAGCHVVWDDRWPGVRRFHTFDPFGNRVELLADA
jgi:catechol 2,3-dioxygenase-like lactoylglutathione lyase family enzyme